MPLTKQEFDDVINRTCPKCADGNPPKFRPDTNEWIHDYISDSGKFTVTTHSFCLASGLRKAFGEFNG